MERETGIEPATNGLGSRDSTTELLPLIMVGREKSNTPELPVASSRHVTIDHRILGLNQSSSVLSCESAVDFVF